MSLAQHLEQTIRANRLLNLPVDWHDEVIFPAYDGLSILNISQSILGLLGAKASAPLNPIVWGETPPSVKRVILIVLDGLGYQFLQKFAQEDEEIDRIISEFTHGRGLLPLTSSFPSTTAVALPTYWHGQPAGETGMLGTNFFLQQQSLLADILFFRPADSSLPIGALDQWGLNAENFVTKPTLIHRLNEIGVNVHILVDRALYGSGLSKIMHRGDAQIHLHMGYSDWYLRLGQLMQDTLGTTCYINAYNPAFDSISHAYGADSVQAKQEARMQLRQLHATLTNPALHDGNTLIMIAADHGHADATDLINLQENPAYHPLLDAMRCNFGAEERLPYFYLREGTKQNVTDFLTTYLSDKFTWIEREAAIQAGLFGDKYNLHPDVHHRIGDLILIPRQGTRLQAAPYTAKMVSAHGGMSSREMLVPFLWRVV
jgi:predicted AlkP superfamily pyrophosphatase or phosphodiesterase